MKKKQNKETEKKFQQLLAKFGIKKEKELFASTTKNNEYQKLYVKRNKTVEKE